VAPASYLICIEYPGSASDEEIFRSLLAGVVHPSALDLLEENDQAATFAFPDFLIDSPTVGKVTRQANFGRQIQFGLKYSF